MKKFSLLVALIVISCAGVFAQNTPITESNYQLAERFSPTKVGKMIYSTSVTPTWLKDGKSFWYTYSTSEGKMYYLVDAVKQTKKPLFDHVKMAAELSAATGDPMVSTKLNIVPDFEDDGKSFRFTVQSKKEVDKKLTEKEQAKEDEKKAKLEAEGKEYKAPKAKKENKKFNFIYTLATGKLVEDEDYEAEKRYPGWANVSPDGQYAIFAKNHNLYYVDAENLAKGVQDAQDSTIVAHQLTTNGENGFSYGGGKTDDMDEEKLKKFKEQKMNVSVLWSPDSKHFTIVRRDSRSIKKLWVINSLASPRPTLETYDYQMAGDKESYEFELSLFNMDTKEQKVIDIDEYKDQTITSYQKRGKAIESRYAYYTASEWLGTNDFFHIGRTSRDHKRHDDIRINVHTGEVSVIAKTEMNISLEDRNLFMLGKGEKNIIRSERDGWAHYYLYNGNGELINQITKGEYHADQVVAVDEKANQMYFSAYGVEEGQNPYYQHLCRINLDGTGFTVLNKGDYHFTSSINDDNTFFVSNYSRVDSAPQSALYDGNGRKLMALEKSDMSSLLASGYKYPERFTVKAADGVTDLYGVMYKPFDFDSTRLYPIIEYVYPGPQTEAVNEAFAAPSPRLEQLAQLGFVVITVGNRGGHSVRSKWYHTYGYNNLRDYGLADKKRAVEQLAARHNFIDISKVGIHGHSGGGFMSTAAMLVYPDFFKVAVSSAGNHDNNIYNRWWGEKHNGVKEVVSESSDTTFVFKVATNPEVAKNLKGKLLLFHGEIDNNVHPANTMRVVDALIRAKKRFDMIILPTQRHGFGDMNNYWFWRTADYFSEHLIGDSKINETHIPEMSE